MPMKSQMLCFSVAQWMKKKITGANLRGTAGTDNLNVSREVISAGGSSATAVAFLL